MTWCTLPQSPRLECCVESRRQGGENGEDFLVQGMKFYEFDFQTEISAYRLCAPDINRLFIYHIVLKKHGDNRPLEAEVQTHNLGRFLIHRVDWAPLA